VPLPVETVTGRIDIFHSPDFVLPPMLARAAVVTIHDLSYVTHPATAHPAQKRFLDAAVPRSVERASRVIAVSEATRGDLVELYDVPAAKVEVIHNGLDPIFRAPPSEELLAEVRRRFQLPARFVLAAGTVQPRKNLPAAAAAVAAIRRRGIDLHLVHFGAPGWLCDSVYRDLERLDEGGFIHLLGPVEDRWLPALYALAGATLAVSLAEGFMFPIVESMAIGTPVVASNVSSMPEVAGGAALLVDPLSVEEIADAVMRVLGDRSLAAGMRSQGLQRAGTFTWEKSAERTESVYLAALET